MRKSGLLGVFIAVVVLQSCGGSGTTGIVTPPPPPPPAPPPTCPANTLCMLSASFDPESVNVPKGTAVTFQNNSGVTHNIVFDTPKTTGVTDIGQISSGTAVRTFNESGTWNLHCTIHAGMTAQVIVP
jgi:hypothetical protein